MSTSVPVDGLVFDFDERWHAVKWDEHPAFRKSKLCGFEGTKAVDILALHDHDRLWLIEAIDVRGDLRRIRTKNTQRAREEPFEIEVARKIRDTLAATVWVQDRIPEAVQLVRLLKQAWRGDAGKVQVALWLEGLDEAGAMPLRDAISARLPWLNVRVHVTNSMLAGRHPKAAIEGLTVRTSARTA